MPNYVLAGDSVHSIIRRVIEDYHPDLARADVAVGAVMAHPKINDKGEPVERALRLHGDPCLATVKINGKKNRLEGMPDATITLSEPEWSESTDERRRALIDHELYHLIVRMNSRGEPKTDDGGRPVLKMRRHDWVYTGFQVIAERHGEASEEIRQARELHDRWGNLLFDFAEDLAVAGAVGGEGSKSKSARR